MGDGSGCFGQIGRAAGGPDAASNLLSRSGEDGIVVEAGMKVVVESASNA